MIKSEKIKHNAKKYIGTNRNILNLSDDIPMQVRILRELPQTFPEILEYLRVDLFDLSVKKMADSIGTSVKTLERLRTRIRKTYAIDYIILLAVGLHLPPWLSFAILERAGICLQCTVADMTYGNILLKGYENTLEEAQKYLENNGVPKLKTDF